MNFFEAQHVAKRNTFWLVVLFILAFVLTGVLVYITLHTINILGREQLDNVGIASHQVQQNYLLITAGVMGVMLVASLLRLMQLSQGGDVVARQMNGWLVPRGTKDPNERVLINVVNEMSVASGVPVPSVYLIEDNAINAFAAGTNVNNAVIGVTRGAINHFTRPELQAVIAHEFSHILNGDMRLNIRLIGAIFGLSVLSYIGEAICRTSFYSRRREGGGLAALGIALLIIGSLGVFFTTIIRMVISRQREFIADAAAVQFTRSTSIASALYRIGYMGKNSSRLESPKVSNVSEFSNIFFSQAVGGFLNNLFASHPPIETRIKRVLPHWDGQQSLISEKVAPAPSPPPASAQAMPSAHDKVGLLMAQIGTIAMATETMQRFDSSVPTALQKATENPYSARALLYALIIDLQDFNIGQKQLEYLETNADTGVYDQVWRLVKHVSDLSGDHKFILIQEAIAPLRELSVKQYNLFLDNLSHVVQLDNHISLFEWSLQAMVVHALNDYFYPNTKVAAASSADWAYALSQLLDHGGWDPVPIYAKIATELSLEGEYHHEAFDGNRLFNALFRMSKCSAAQKEKYVRSFVMAVMDDNHINDQERLLLRLFLSILDCPLPANFKV